MRMMLITEGEQWHRWYCKEGVHTVHVQTIIASGSSPHELPTPPATNPLYLFDHDPLILPTVRNMSCLDHYFGWTQFVVAPGFHFIASAFSKCLCKVCHYLIRVLATHITTFFSQPLFDFTKPPLTSFKFFLSHATSFYSSQTTLL